MPAGRVRTLDEVYEWEQTRSQGLLIGVDRVSLGPLILPAPPLRFHQAPPALDQHGDALRQEFGGR